MTPPPHMPWRLYLLLWEVRKYTLRLLLNLRHRRPFWSPATWRRHLRMLDSRRLPPDAIPVIINNFNKLDSIKTLVAWLQCSRGRRAAIVILDNGSTFPPLRAWYRTLRDVPDLQIVRLGYNARLWGIADAVRELADFRRYVVTDPDLVPYPATPPDLLQRMDEALDAYPRFSHVGASLEIRDLPDHYPLKAEVLAWEARYWPPQAEAVDTVGYVAWVDTTFGMYRQGADVTRIEPAMRLARPYTLKHVDWYQDPANLTAEQRFYRRVSRPVASWTERLRQRGL